MKPSAGCCPCRGCPSHWALFAACGGGSATRPGAGTPSDKPRDTVPATSQDVATPTAPPAPPVAVGHPRNDLIPRAVLFGNPERTAPQVSPDGKWLAFGAPAGGVINVFVAPAGDLAKAVQVTFDKQRPVRQYFWSNDGKYIVYLQDQAGDENFHVFRVGPDGKGALDLTPKAGVQSNFSKLEVVIDKTKGGVTKIRYFDGSGTAIGDGLGTALNRLRRSDARSKDVQAFDQQLGQHRAAQHRRLASRAPVQRLEAQPAGRRAARRRHRR